MKKVIIVLLIILVIIVALILGYIVLNKGSEEENTVIKNNVENTNNIENEDEDNDIENNENNENDQNIEIPENITVVKEVLPSGFMGSSFYKVVLYSNKNVYLETYNGDRSKKSNLLSRTLIAEKVDTIERGEDDDNYGEVIIKGGTVKDDSIGWIIFK